MRNKKFFLFDMLIIPENGGRPDAGPWSGLMLWLQKVAGEPWLWSIQPEELGLFLAETGWKNDTEQVWAKRKYGVEFYAAAIK